jgi:hypothetical protein
MLRDETRTASGDRGLLGEWPASDATRISPSVIATEAPKAKHNKLISVGPGRS